MVPHLLVTSRQNPDAAAIMAVPYLLAGPRVQHLALHHPIARGLFEYDELSMKVPLPSSSLKLNLLGKSHFQSYFTHSFWSIHWVLCIKNSCLCKQAEVNF